MSLISKLAKMSAADRAKFLAEQMAAADLIAQKAANTDAANAALETALTQLETDTEKSIADLESAASARVAVIVAEISAKYGVELSATRKRANSGPVPARYRNPNDHTQTWSGRGKPASWIAEIGGLDKCEDLMPEKAEKKAAAAAA